MEIQQSSPANSDVEPTSVNNPPDLKEPRSAVSSEAFPEGELSDAIDQMLFSEESSQ